MTQDLLTKHPIDRGSVYLAVGILSGVGAMISSTMPMVIGTMAETFKFSEPQLGDLIAAFNLTFTLIAFLSLFFIRRINWKLAALLASVICIVSWLSFTLTDNYSSIMVLFGTMGLGMGGLYALGMTIMGDSGTPDRAFGVKLGLETLPPILMLFILPVFVIPLYGFSGMAYAMAATCLLAGLLSSFLPSRGVKSSAHPAPDLSQTDKDAPPLLAPKTSTLALSLVTLISSIVFFSGCMACWAFLEIIGTDKGITADKVGIILALSMVSAAVGAFFAAWLGDKLGRNIPVIAMAIVNIVGLTLIWQSASLASFACGTILFTFCVNYGLAYFFGLSAEVDLSGQFVVLSAMTLSLGGVFGPAAAGRLMEGYGFTSVLLFTAMCSIVSLMLYLLVVRQSRAS